MEDNIPKIMIKLEKLERKHKFLYFNYSMREISKMIGVTPQYLFNCLKKEEITTSDLKTKIFIDYIYSLKKEEINLNRISTDMKLSTETISSLFKNVFGMSLKEYRKTL